MPRLRPRAVLNRSDLPQRSAFEEAPNGGAEPAGRAGGDYMARLITYIPGEVIAVYQAVAGLLKPQAKAPSAAEVSAASGPLLAVGLVLLLLTPIWIFFSTRERNEPAAVHQIVISTLAFLVWLLAVDNPIVAVIPFWEPRYGSIAIIVCALLIFPLLEMIFKQKSPS